MQRNRRMLNVVMIGFAVTGVACSHAQSISEIASDGKLAELKDKATPSPTSTPEILPLPPDVRPFSVSDGVILGMAIRKVQPVYPFEAQAKGITGEVKIRVTIDQDGSVAEAIPLGGYPLFQAAALTAVKQWRWPPTLIDTNRPVYVRGTLTFHFPPRT